ncbi:hypothetical protein P7K49_002157 [Saguinus oedipus]|uniref:Uncharacterized protein n=1 Tax=Saguinus oedipus TaxID=9490 RepID=A0ABQ9WHH1_SAGOE|nr:hypothetical protein P7K49_002157 [Saguinus oedipus]
MAHPDPTVHAAFSLDWHTLQPHSASPPGAPTPSCTRTPAQAWGDGCPHMSCGSMRNHLETLTTINGLTGCRAEGQGRWRELRQPLATGQQSQELMFRPHVALLWRAMAWGGCDLKEGLVHSGDGALVVGASAS